MPLFFFHFVAKTLVPAEVGVPFETAEQALSHAREMAAQLASNELLAGCAIVVATEDEQHLFEIPLPPDGHMQQR